MVKLLNQDIQTKEVLEWKGLHLFHFWGSSCSQKTRIVLNMKDLKWSSHEVNLGKSEHFLPWYLGINPRGLVPTLIKDGEVHIESNDIIQLLDSMSPQNKLVPEIGIGTDGFSLGLVYFFKPKSSKNKKLKNNEDVYTELKKLNELLELGIITQEEYVKKAEELKKVILD